MAAVVYGPGRIASEVELVSGALDAIARDLRAAPGGYEWTVEAARHVGERLLNAEKLLNEARVLVDNAKRDAMRRRSEASA